MAASLFLGRLVFLFARLVPRRDGYHFVLLETAAHSG
jgi:hypothetical protein